MIRIEELHEFQPGIEQLLFPYAAEEFLRAGELQQKILRESEIARVIYYGDELLAYAGLVRQSLLNPPILWLLLGKNITRWSARLFRQIMRKFCEQYGTIYTVIECSHKAGHRFARFCGFRPLGAYVEILGRRFECYEVK